MSQRRMLAAGVFATLLLSLLSVSEVRAHHSVAGFESEDKAIVLEGTVAEYRWRNPHVLVFWDVESEDGEAVRWVGELSSVNTSISNGLSKQSLQVGDRITVTAIPSRSGTPVSLIHRLVKEDGTVLVEP
jgi:hypothetical protein